MTIEQLALRAPGNRIRVFIDFWNVQLALDGREQTVTGIPDTHFLIDWQKLPQVVANNAAQMASVGNFAYEGTAVYVSYNPTTQADTGLRGWLHTWLNRQPGIQVVAKGRHARRPPSCPSCHRSIASCPHCNSPIRATIEKGIDTAMVTDMIRLAWEDAFDIGAIVSSDSDFVPVINFLDAKGKKMIQGGFPPQGIELATACWASFDLWRLRESFRRSLS